VRRTIVCLANSYKHGGRCVAGVCLETGEWLRLRGPNGDGALAAREYVLADGAGEVRLLDVFEAVLHYAMPTDCHPEDWVIAAVSWRLLERPCSAECWKKVLEAEESGSSLLGGYRDRVGADELRKKPAKTSLALVSPSEMCWWVREVRGERKNRALFQRHHVTFNFPVTDPRWVAQMNLLPLGIYPHKMLAPDAGKTWLTVSLSEAFVPNATEAWHFRIVAGVVVR
jgi:hypothetical protein